MNDLNNEVLAKREPASQRATVRESVAKRNVSTSDIVTAYLVTLKAHTMRHVTKAELDDSLACLIKKLKRAEWSDLVAYEEDSVNRMHLHTICTITGKTPYFKRLQVKGWSVDFTPVLHTRAMKYVLKLKQDKYAIEQRFEENSYKWGSMFT